VELLDEKMRMRVVEKTVESGGAKWRVIEVLFAVAEKDDPAIQAELVNAAQDIYQRYLPKFQKDGGYQEDLKTVAVRQSRKR